MESQGNSSGPSSQDSIRCSSETPEIFTGRILFMSMFNDISCGTKDNEKECLAHAKVVSLYARKFGTGQWSFIGPASEKKWYSMKEDSPQGIWDNIACYDPIVQRSTQKQRTWKTVDTFYCSWKYFSCFRSIGET